MKFHVHVVCTISFLPRALSRLPWHFDLSIILAQKAQGLTTAYSVRNCSMVSSSSSDARVRGLDLSSDFDEAGSHRRDTLPLAQQAHMYMTTLIAGRNTGNGTTSTCMQLLNGRCTSLKVNLLSKELIHRLGAQVRIVL